MTFTLENELHDHTILSYVSRITREGNIPLYKYYLLTKANERKQVCRKMFCRYLYNNLCMLHDFHAMLDPLLPLSGDCKAFYTLYFVHIDRVFGFSDEGHVIYCMFDGKFKEYEVSDIQVKQDGCSRQAPKDTDTVDEDILFSFPGGISHRRRVLLPI